MGLLALALDASTAGGQSIQALIHEGGTIEGMGSIEKIRLQGVNDSGTWVGEVETDFETPSRDEALLRDGAVELREGITLPLPPGAELGDFVGVDLTATGDLGLLIGFPGAIQSRGVFWNLVPAVVTGDPFDEPGIAPNSTWRSLLHAKLNSNRELLVFGELVTTGSTVRKHTLARYRVDQTGAVTSIEVLASKGLPMAALGGELLNVMPTNSGATCQNERGDFLCVVDGVDSSPAVLLNMETILAQVGQPSPVNGLVWKYLDRIPRTSINDFGDYVFTGSTQHPTDPDPDAALYVIIKNGDVFAKEGDLVGSFTEPMGKGSLNPVLITNSGDVYWYWQNEAGTESALMRNDQAILQENVTQVVGNLVVDIPTQDNFRVSHDGRFWIGRVDMQNLGETLFLADFGLVVPIPGCHANPGRLTLVEGMAVAGDHLLLAMDNGQAPGVAPILFFSTAPRISPSPCGTMTPFGELLIGLRSRFLRLVLPIWDGTNPSLIDLSIPKDIALVDAEFYLQGMFVDIDATPAENFRPTNGMRVQIGAP